MQTMVPTYETPNDRGHRRWSDSLLLAQLDRAECLTRALGDGRLNQHSYRDWLASESAACRIGALSLDAVAGWHCSQPGLQVTAQAWASEWRELAQLAAADVRAVGAIAAAPPAQLGEWQAFLAQAGGSQRAGEVLGAAALNCRLLDGPVRGVLAAIKAQSFAVHACGYLTRRLQPEPATVSGARSALLDAYSLAALTVGAQRATSWSRGALMACLR
jgi:hypothetical protein